MRTAADKMDNFEFVTIRKLSGGPAIATNQFAVELDSHAVGFHAELRNQVGEGANGAAFARFAVDGELHLAAMTCQSTRGMGFGKLIKPSSLLNRLRNLQPSGVADRLQRLLDLVS